MLVHRVDFAALQECTLLENRPVPYFFALVIDALNFAICIALGALNGFLVVKTGLPSFIVTLAFLYILRGMTIWLSILASTDTIVDRALL